MKMHPLTSYRFSGNLYFLFILFTFFIILSVAEGCNNSNPTGPNNVTDPNLLFSKDSLVCDYHDSVYVNNTYYYFFDSLIYYVSSFNYSKVKITFDAQLTNDSLSNLMIGLYHNLNLTPGDTSYYFDFSRPLLNSSYSFIFNLNYPSNYDFYLKIYLSIGNSTNQYFPFHSDFIKLKNIKIYKD